jgi:hypothetical protein
LFLVSGLGKFTSSLTLLLKEKGTAPSPLRRGVGDNKKVYRTQCFWIFDRRVVCISFWKMISEIPTAVKLDLSPIAIGMCIANCQLVLSVRD